MASVSKVTQMAHQFARICVFGDVRVQFRQQARQQSHGLRRERPVWFGEQVVAGESRGFESGLLLVDQRLQTGTLRGDAGPQSAGPARAAAAGCRTQIAIGWFKAGCKPAICPTVRHGCRFA